MGRILIPGFRKIETSGSGEGGTTNYNDLTNKPSINNVSLVENLNTADLHLTDATLTEEGVPAEAKTVGTKLEEHSTSLTALSEQLGNHTVKSDVPENAKFTDTVYDDTEVKESIDELNSNLSQLEYSDVAGGKNLFNPKCLLNATYDEKTDTITVSPSINKALNMVFKENTQYTFSAYIKQSSSNSNIRLSIIYTDGTEDNVFLLSQSTTEVYASKTSESGKTISTVRWYCGNNGTATFRNLQIEEGTTATNYEPYIPSVKMIADEVSAQNESLEGYGLVGQSITDWYQGWIGSDGTVSISTSLNGSLIKQNITCKIGDVITIVCDSSEEEINIGEFDSSNAKANTVTSKNYTNRLEYKVSLSSTTYVRFSIRGKTPANVGNIKVYINNSIDEIKNDLDKLNSLPIGSIIQIEADKDNIETTEQKYGWQYLGTSNIECNDESVKLLVTNVYRKNS